MSLPQPFPRLLLLCFLSLRVSFLLRLLSSSLQPLLLFLSLPLLLPRLHRLSLQTFSLCFFPLWWISLPWKCSFRSPLSHLFLCYFLWLLCCLRLLNLSFVLLNCLLFSIQNLIFSCFPVSFLFVFGRFLSDCSSFALLIVCHLHRLCCFILCPADTVHRKCRNRHAADKYQRQAHHDDPF